MGGGFGGLYAARELRKAGDRVAVTLVDRRNHHLFQPLLYQVATGALSPGEIAQPLRSIFRKQRNTTVLLGEATGIDPAAREVARSRTASASRTTRSSSRPAPGTATSGTTTGRRTRPVSRPSMTPRRSGAGSSIAFEAAEREADPDRRREWMTFVLVGGGPTGVELAGALGEIANDTLRSDFRSIRPQDARIELIEAVDRILPMYPPDRSASAAAQLARLGVTVRTRTRVVDIGEA